MGFSFYTVYRTDEEQAPSRWLAGAAPYKELVGKDAWVFWQGDTDDVKPPTRLFIFAERKDEPGGVVAGKLADTGEVVRFIPLTVDHVLENPAAYPRFEQAVKEETLTQGDLYLVFNAAEVGEAYEEGYGPLAELVTLEDIELLGESMVRDMLIENTYQEAKGVPAPIGAIHRWKDQHDYQKQPDSSWKRVDTQWVPEHPDVPKSTKNQFWDKNWGWDPHRKKLHAKLLDDVRKATFGSAKPVPKGEEPVFTYIMGPPAAGKSTRTRNAEYNNAVKLDPDEFVERLPEFQKAVELKSRNGAQSVVEEALMLNDALIDEAKEGRYNFIVAGTGANLQWMEKELFPDLKKRGYRINVFMTYVDDLDELMLRTEERGHKGGRFVPPERTKTLHETLPKNFKELMKNPDVTSLVLVNSHQTEDQTVKNDVAYLQQGSKVHFEGEAGKQFFDDVMKKAE
jgi:predicted ABC-type ATPase